MTSTEKRDFASSMDSAIRFESELDRAVDDINASVGLQADTTVDDLVPGLPEYPKLSRTIDMVALLVLAAAIFAPVMRLGFRSMQLAETDGVWLFMGAALVGLLGSLAGKRSVAVLGALAYGGFFAYFVANYFTKMQEVRAHLKDNMFGGFFDGMVGLDWGCAAITLCVLAVLFSMAIARNGDR